MQVKPEALGAAVAKQLAPAYLISGDEALLVEEAANAIRGAAERAGYTERKVLFAESGFNWAQVMDEGASLSLFAEKKLIDVRVPAKIDRSGSDVLRTYLERPPEDTILVVRTPRLDRSQRNSAWFKAFDSAGAVVLIWGVDTAQWPRWLRGRLSGAKLQLEEEAVKMFADMLEGNLLAAVQEIEKLKLAGLPQPISAEDLARSLDDSSRYDVFELIDAVFAADGRRVSRIVATLRHAGTSVFAVLGPFVSQMRQLSGGGWMPRDRARAAEQFKRRVRNVDGVLAECALIDQQGKGQILGDAWESLERLLLRLSGARELAMLGEHREILQR